MPPEVISMGPLATDVINQKYSHKKRNGKKEDWNQIARRTVRNVLHAVDAEPDLVNRMIRAVRDRKTIPGGRYLAVAGRPYHQTQNCFLFRAEDSREGWAELLHKSTLALMSGGGIGVNYSDIREEHAPIRRIGGTCMGPVALMHMVNESGRFVRHNDRKAAIWAGLSWSHPDIHKFIQLKNWSKEVRSLKEKDFNFPAPMDGTNISVCLDDKFFEAYRNKKDCMHTHAHSVYWATIERMLKTGEPGFSVDVGENAGENFRNAPVSANTYVLSSEGYVRVGDVVEQEIRVWTGKQWASTTFKRTKENTPVVKVRMTGGREIICDPNHEFLVENWVGYGINKKLTNISKVKASNLRNGDILHVSLGISEPEHSPLPSVDYYVLGSKFLEDPDYGNRISFLYNLPVSEKCEFLAGLFDSHGNSFHSIITLSSDSFLLLTGVRRILESVGIFSNIKGGIRKKFALEVDKNYINEFSNRIPSTIVSKNPFNVGTSHVTVVSVEDAGTEDVFCCDVGVEEHSFQAEGVIISNCTEITSADDCDVCNLISPVLSKIKDKDEFAEIVKLSTIFALAGTVYSDVPFVQVDKIRTKNRRLGVGLMGIHEWLLVRGYSYAPCDELAEWLDIYKEVTTEVAKEYAKKWKLTVPVKTRSVAPNGSIGIAAETTTGIEPIFAVAYKRRYLKGFSTWCYQYVVDPTAKRLIEENGVRPDSIEDSYILSRDIEKRVTFQAWIQKWVDHGISSTINLPAWGTEYNNETHGFGTMLMKYLPELRGITTYPEGARGGQPLSPISYQTAMKHVGEIFEEVVDVCELSGKGGGCG